MRSDRLEIVRPRDPAQVAKVLPVSPPGYFRGSLDGGTIPLIRM
jgi:hypothetical protein